MNSATIHGQGINDFRVNVYKDGHYLSFAAADDVDTLLRWLDDNHPDCNKLRLINVPDKGQISHDWYRRKHEVIV